MAKKIAEQYRLLDEVEHVLARPGMYLGQTGVQRTQEWDRDGDRLVRVEVDLSPALLKIFDEIVTNSVDESVRNPKLNEVRVTIGEELSVEDNGGIPVVKHPQHGVLVPEMVFSNLRAGSNFDDSEDRLVAGTHGLGSTLTNIFSSRFTVQTADGKRAFEQTFTANMSARTKPRVSASRKRYTRISFVPDYKRFGMSGMDAVHAAAIRRRVADLAACNPKVRFLVDGHPVGGRTFREYAESYCGPVVVEESGGWRVAVGKSEDGFQQVSFVNSAETRDGGSHVNAVVAQVVEHVRDHIRKKHKVEVRSADVKAHLFLVLVARVVNPSFSTQTKEKLTTPPGDLGAPELSARTLKAVVESGVADAVLDWARRKSEADERAELRRMSKDLGTGRVEKLVDARGRDRDACSLGVFEGMSALAAVRRYRDPQLFGAFPLKGKFINVSELSPAEVMRNAEASDLMSALGLRPGEPPGELRYGRLLVYTDADTDGSSIFCLLLNFVARFWPEMFDQGRVFRVLTPLAVAKRGSEARYMYTQDELASWKGGKGWELEYKKGLGSLEGEEYRRIIQEPVLMRVDRDADYRRSLDCWFGPDAVPRKGRLMPAGMAK